MASFYADLLQRMKETKIQTKSDSFVRFAPVVNHMVYLGAESTTVTTTTTSSGTTSSANVRERFPEVKVCEDYSTSEDGMCVSSWHCNKWHAYIFCKDFQNSGSCERGERCPYIHGTMAEQVCYDAHLLLSAEIKHEIDRTGQHLANFVLCHRRGCPASCNRRHYDIIPGRDMDPKCPFCDGAMTVNNSVIYSKCGHASCKGCVAKFEEGRRARGLPSGSGVNCQKCGNRVKGNRLIEVSIASDD